MTETLKELKQASAERDALVEIVEACIISFEKLSQSAANKANLLREMLLNPLDYVGDDEDA